MLKVLSGNATTSCMACNARRSRRAACRISSACSRSFIQNNTFPKGTRDNVIGCSSPATELRGIEQQHVDRMGIGGQAPANISGDSPPASVRRKRLVVYDEKIDVRVDVRGAVRLRPEQDD